MTYGELTNKAKVVVVCFGYDWDDDFKSVCEAIKLPNEPQLSVVSVKPLEANQILFNALKIVRTRTFIVYTRGAVSHRTSYGTIEGLKEIIKKELKA